MFVLEVIVGVVLLAAVAFVASHDVRGLDETDASTADVGVPQGRLIRSDDIDRLRFRVVGGWWGAVRGYRYTDVDEALAAVQQALAAHEERASGSSARGRPGARSAGDVPPAQS
ncbi:MAG: hypothetical protein JO222_13635 [Frankiales bacterium]|nr:hypothetical protein [Frankiales bacterium]